MQTHGDHWSCLYSDMENFPEQWLPQLLKRLPLLRQVPWTNPENIPSGENADSLSIFAEQSEVRHMFIVLSHSHLQKHVFFSGYPVAVQASELSLRVTKVTPCEYGIEGTVSAEIGEQGEITFFDSLFFLNRNRYKVGEFNRIRLAAFGYVVKPLNQEYVEIDDPERAAVLRETLNMPKDKPVRFLMTDFVARLPGETVDDCDFASPIKAISALNVNGLVLHQATIAIARLDEDLDAPLYFAPHVARNDPLLATGSMLQGAYWLQGYLSESHAFFLGH